MVSFVQKLSETATGNETSFFYTHLFSVTFLFSFDLEYIGRTLRVKNNRVVWGCIGNIGQSSLGLCPKYLCYDDYIWRHLR